MGNRLDFFKKSTAWPKQLWSRRNEMPALPSSPSGRSPGLLRDVPVSLPPIPWPRLTPYRVSRQARAGELLSPGARGPAVRSTDNAGMDRGAKQRLRGERRTSFRGLALSGAVARRLPGSAQLGRGWLLPSLRPAHRPPRRPLSAAAAAPLRGSEPGRPPGAGWHPSPCLPRASPERHCWEGVPGLMSPVLYPPLPTLLGFAPASSTCGLSSPLWAFLPLPFLWLWMSPQTRFYESGLVQGLYKVFSEIRGPVICKTNKNVQ